MAPSTECLSPRRPPPRLPNPTPPQSVCLLWQLERAAGSERERHSGVARNQGENAVSLIVRGEVGHSAVRGCGSAARRHCPVNSLVVS